MKVTKTEKIWLAAVAIFYLLYNLPGFPKLADTATMSAEMIQKLQVQSLVHGAITLVCIWAAVYIGLGKVYKIYALRDTEEEGNK